MSSLLTVVERARDNPLLAEEYLARETVGDGGAPDPRPGQAAAVDRAHGCRSIVWANSS